MCVDDDDDDDIEKIEFYFCVKHSSHESNKTFDSKGSSGMHEIICMHHFFCVFCHYDKWWLNIVIATNGIAMTAANAMIKAFCEAAKENWKRVWCVYCCIVCVA